MDTNTIPKQALQYIPKGRSHIGRQRKRWRDQFHFEDQGTGNTSNPSWTWWWWWWKFDLSCLDSFTNQKGWTSVSSIPTFTQLEKYYIRQLKVSDGAGQIIASDSPARVANNTTTKPNCYCIQQEAQLRTLLTCICLRRRWIPCDLVTVTALSWCHHPLLIHVCGRRVL